MKRFFKVLAIVAAVVLLAGCSHGNGGGKPGNTNNNGNGTGGGNGGSGGAGGNENSGLYARIAGEWEIEHRNITSNEVYPRYAFTTTKENGKHILYAYIMTKEFKGEGLCTGIEYSSQINILKGNYSVTENTISISFTEFLKNNAWEAIQAAAENDLAVDAAQCNCTDASYSFSQVQGGKILTIPFFGNDSVKCHEFADTETRLAGSWYPSHCAYETPGTLHNITFTSDGTFSEGTSTGTYETFTAAYALSSSDNTRPLQAGYIILHDDQLPTGIKVFSFLINDFAKFRINVKEEAQKDILFLKDDFSIPYDYIQGKNKTKEVNHVGHEDIYLEDFYFAHLTFDDSIENKDGVFDRPET